MNNNVYVVIEDYASSLGDNGVDVHVFREQEKATQYLAKCVLEIGDFIDCDEENKVENIDHEYYEVYEEGAWSNNHYVAYIEEKDILWDHI